jgi:hypothetical protein
MADVDIEDGLRAMFASTEPLGDAEAFALSVEERLGRRQWIRLGVVAALGLLGLLIAWLELGLSAGDVLGGLNALSGAAQGGGGDNAGGWAAALLLLGLGLFVVRPAFSET